LGLDLKKGCIKVIKSDSNNIYNDTKMLYSWKNCIMVFTKKKKNCF